MGKVKKRTPPVKVAESKQYDLFTEFFGDQSELSNTIEIWDAIPKYAVSARRQVGIRDKQGRLPVHEYEFAYNNKPCRIEVQPASLKVDGRFRDFYPSVDEELIEEVLRKIFADQRFGLHNAPAAESWVKFSLSMIRTELKHRGKTRSIDEIKRSIEILSRTTLAFYVDTDDTPIYTAPILSDLTRVNRAAFLDDPKSLWYARLPALVSKSVNDLTYRQFNYGKLMAMQSQLARWMHKRLSHRYTNASVLQDHGLLFTTIQRDSGLLTANRITKNRQALESSLNELVEMAVLLDWAAEERRGAHNRIEDVLYTLKAHPEFVRDVKAANARRNENAAKIEGRSVGGPGGRRSGQKVVGGADMK